MAGSQSSDDKQDWHEIGYGIEPRAAWENFLERGKAGGGLGTPVLRTSVVWSSPIAALLLFSPALADVPPPPRARSPQIWHENAVNRECVMPLFLMISVLFAVIISVDLQGCQLVQGLNARENHANARKIFDFVAFWWT